MALNVEILNDNEESLELEKFIETSANGTIFHRPRFLGYHLPSKFPSEDFSICHFLFRHRGSIVAFVPGLLCRQANGAWIYKSHCGASYGGFVLGRHLLFKRIEEIVDLFFQTIKEKAAAFEMTPTAEIHAGPNSPMINYMHYALLRRNCVIGRADLLMAHDTSLGATTDEQLSENAVAELRTASKYDFVFEVSMLSEKIYSMLEISQKRFGAVPTHTYDEMRRIEELFPNRVKVFVTSYRGSPAASIIGFLANWNVLNTFYICDDDSLRTIKPNYYSYYRTLEWARAEGIRYVDFGPSSFGYQPHESLIFFKEKFGSKPFLRVHYIWKKNSDL